MLKAAAVLFDMDGVVIDTKQSVEDFWRAVADEHGVALTEADFETHIHGVPAVKTLRALFPAVTGEREAAFMERIVGYERGLSYREVAGTVAFLKRLKAAGVRTGLVTSGMEWKVAAVAGQLRLGGLFDVTVTAGDIERGKPDPDCYLAAARKLGVGGSECVVFEDAVSGVRSAVAAGSVCVGVQTGRMADVLRAEGAVHVVPDFSAAAVAAGPSAVAVRLAGGFEVEVERR